MLKKLFRSVRQKSMKPLELHDQRHLLSLDIIPYWLIPWAFGLIKEGV